MRVYRVVKTVLIVLLVVILAVSVFVAVRGSAIVADLCTAEINAKINDIVNASNEILLALDVLYADYFTVEYDEAHKVSAIYANTGLINQMTLIWNTEIQNRLNDLREYPIRFPSGMLTGSGLLSKYGREITVVSHTVSNCAITFRSQFLQSGINQTVHRFTMFTEVNGDITVPGNAKNVLVSQEIVLAETVLNGEVPESYLLGDSSVNYLDLLP